MEPNPFLSILPYKKCSSRGGEVKMEQFNINGHIVKVDVQKTKELYEPLPLISDKAHCGCEDCSYYTKTIVHTSLRFNVFSNSLALIQEKKQKFGELAKITMEPITM